MKKVQFRPVLEKTFMTIEDKKWPFMQGFQNRPETLSPCECKLESSIPSWLSGTLLRIGPGVFDIQTKNNKTFSFNHWFDGLGVSIITSSTS
jgi:carotenoid cleavage dioxygenase-like enzyme